MSAANAAPVVPGPVTPRASNIVQAAGGCGGGWHPNRWGHCVPNRYGYYGPRPHWRGYYGGIRIIQALIVRVARQLFAIPLTSVAETLRIMAREIQTVEAREVLALRELTLPLVRLADAFALDSEEDGADRKLFVVVTRSGEKLAGVVVDAIVRQQEIVIKSIGERLARTPGIAGATEVGSGEIVLVVDVASLMETFGGRARERRSYA